MAAKKNNGPANIGFTASIAIVVFPHFSRYIVNPDEIGKILNTFSIDYSTNQLIIYLL